MRYELQITDAAGKRRIVEADGRDGVAACHDYAASHKGATVYAWRVADRANHVAVIEDASRVRILEPGDRGW